MPRPQIHITQTGVTPVIIALSGRQDLATTPDLHTAVRHAIDAGNGVVVDLSDATFVDSSILRTLIEAHRSAADAGGTEAFTVVAPVSSIAAQLFDLVGAAEILAVFGSRDDALATYPGHPRASRRCAFPHCGAAATTEEREHVLCPRHRELLLVDPGEFRRLWGALDPRPVTRPLREPGAPEAPLPPAPGADLA